MGRGGLEVEKGNEVKCFRKEKVVGTLVVGNVKHRIDIYVYFFLLVLLRL